MAKPGTIRRLMLAVASCGGVALIATVVVDTYLVRAEAEAVAQGRIPQAAELAGRVKLLRRHLARKLREQIPLVAASDRRFPRELPLIDALLAIQPDPEMLARRAALRVLTAGPERLDLHDARLMPGLPVPPPGAEALAAWPTAPRPSGQSEPLLVAEPTAAPEPAAPPDTIVQLRRRNLGGAVIPLGDGLVGPWGRSWDVAADGRRAVVARPAERVLERWDLQASRSELIATDRSPVFVALQPDGEAIAYSGPRVPGKPGLRSEALRLWRPGGDDLALYPPGDLKPAALGFQWAPDGKSLLVRWGADPLRGSGDWLSLAWIAPDGRLLMNAVMEGEQPDPTWKPGPGGRMGLRAAGSAWAWDGRAQAARHLIGVRGDWGWSPDGRLIAGIDVGHVFVAATEEPKRRVDHKVEGLAPFFVLDPNGFTWTAEGLTFAGRAAASEKGPWQAVRVDVRLAARD